ncbi:MAG: MBL fold metallo-hydrolase [Candidatus Hadarchaeia archaeon]
MSIIRKIKIDCVFFLNGGRIVSFEWFGQACFEISDSITIVTDPHDGGSVGLEQPRCSGDVVTISHYHFDHSNGKDLVSDEGTLFIDDIGKRKINGLEIHGISSYHDKSEGRKRGENIIFIFELDEMKICHLGDLGHKLAEKKIDDLGNIDVLLIPVGGNYTINAREAVEVVKDLNPSVVIPMHYRVPGLEVEISDDSEFLELARDNGWSIERKEQASLSRFEKGIKIIKLDCKTS